jgi:hypothetical protein
MTARARSAPITAAGILQVALPYRLPAGFPPRMSGPGPEIGGLSLLRVHFFGIAVACEVAVALLVLLRLRLLAVLAIAASVIYWAASRWWIPWIPYPLQLVTAGVYLAELAALLASPGPRRGRELVTWRHGVVLLLPAGAFQAFALWYAATGRPVFAFAPHPAVPAYLVTGTTLAAAAVVLALAWRINRYFLLVFAAACYPCAVQLAFSVFRTDLLGNPMPAHLAALFLPPVLFAVPVVLAAAVRLRAQVPAGPAAPLRAAKPSQPGSPTHIGSDSSPIHSPAPCSRSQPGAAATTGPVWPPAARDSSIHSANGTTGPTASKVPVMPASAPASSQAARSRTSMTWVARPGLSGTSIGPAGSRAARAAQYPVRSLWSPGPPMSPARAISTRPPAAPADARSHATFASPYCSMPATSPAAGGSSAADSSAPRAAWEA